MKDTKGMREIKCLLAVAVLVAGMALKVTPQDLYIIFLSMLSIAAGLVGLCYMIHIWTGQHLSRKAAYSIIDWGYWSGFVIVLFCVFHGAQPVAASPARLVSPPQPTASHPTGTISIPDRYSEPCSPGLMVMRPVPFTDQQKRHQAASCGR